MPTKLREPREYKRLTSAEREKMADKMADLYEDHHMSIREIAEQYGKSYGTVHRYLSKVAGIELRGRGGYRRRKSEDQK